jgi:hypothetical protein
MESKFKTRIRVRGKQGTHDGGKEGKIIQRGGYFLEGHTLPMKWDKSVPTWFVLWDNEKDEVLKKEDELEIVE